MRIVLAILFLYICIGIGMDFRNPGVLDGNGQDIEDAPIQSIIDNHTITCDDNCNF